jgi:hypothetical protein
MVLMMVLIGCSAKSSYNESADATTSSPSSGRAEISVEETKEMESGAYEPDMDMADGIDGKVSNEIATSGSASNTDLQQASDNRKYIRTFDFQIETLDFDGTTLSLEKLVDQYFGFFQSTEVTGRTINNNTSISRQGIYTIRIPKEKAGDFLKGLIGIGNVIDSSSFVEDVTSQYMDLDARIKTLKVQEERLLAILADADELQYVLELERELSSVRYEIESYMTAFRNLDNRINYTTIYVRLYEVLKQTEIIPPPTTFFDKIKAGFTNSLNDAFESIQNVVIFLISNIPSFIVFAVNLLIIYGIIRLLMKTKLFKRVFKTKSTKTSNPVSSPTHDTQNEK